ncbi:efflux RND transporter permease subunit [Algoriphagus sp. AGSA1]|uniref:efflux RND transporter permease subunit n=1 Tax=Algoriphagus sp. AGSA1 TaxID=2907213 RepID=UPI001F4100ED|nr:efflux RND transporter permease subunit [Algoriphagus sp. AGSA1]MCE7055880.1 efflux RND transporter permease subunit [Algoriphagus sp. AGSA1]
MIKKIIDQPVVAMVISILLILAGIMGIKSLPVERFPEIAPPSVNVSVKYPGGNAETIAGSVLLPIEEAINGVEGMTYISSSATNAGTGTINVYFKPGTNPDIAAVNIQNRVSEVTEFLPPEVVEAGISVMKRLKGSIMTINFYSENPSYDETFLQAYIRRDIRRELKRIEGIAEATILRQRDYAMRVWLMPEKMALYGLTPDDVIKQIRDQSFEAAPGKFGEDSQGVFETVIRHEGRFSVPERYENLVIKATNDGSILRLKDVARLEFGASNYASDNKVDGMPGVTMDIVQMSGSNAKEIDERVRTVLEERSRFFPEGMRYDVSYSVRKQIDESMSQVVKTLIEAFLLVFLVVFIFLQNFRVTFITAITIPISLLGTFFFLQLIGSTMNVLSMFSMVLSIGIVVDNGIVVIEAIYEKMHKHGMRARQAVDEAMHEITGAIISITVVISAVFLPVGFLSGPVGVFYQEFAYTIIIAVVISAIISLTLGPVLIILFFKDRVRPKKKVKILEHIGGSKFIIKVKTIRDNGLRKFDLVFDRFVAKYVRMAKWAILHKWLSLAVLVLITAATVFLSGMAPKAFIPTEDDSFLTLSLAMPPASSLHRTTEALLQADSILRDHPAIDGINTVAGNNIVDNAASTSYGMAYIKLKDISERGSIKDLDEVIADITAKLSSQLVDAKIRIYPKPTVQGFGDFSGLEFVMQDREGGDLSDFNLAANDFINEVMSRKEIENAFSSFDVNYPQYKIIIDYEKAKKLGVSISEMMKTIQGYFGRRRVGDFNRFGRQYQVFAQSDIEYREDIKAINSIFVKNNEGKMVPLNTLIFLEQAFGPELVRRYNLYTAVKISAIPAEGYSTNDAMKAVEEIASKLPANYSYEWTGMSLEEKNSGSDATMVFIISIVLVYFILAAQYNSFWLPFGVMLSLPTGLFGVYLAINLAGINNNIYVQVGILMLIGLLAKNAILIVEFASQKRRGGASVLDAVLEASALRVRAIVMTSLAFTVGLIPLMFSVGSAAQGNRSVSIGTAGGMLSGIILGIFIIPVLAYLFQSLHDRFNLETVEHNANHE